MGRKGLCPIYLGDHTVSSPLNPCYSCGKERSYSHPDGLYFRASRQVGKEPIDQKAYRGSLEQKRLRQRRQLRQLGALPPNGDLWGWLFPKGPPV